MHNFLALAQDLVGRLPAFCRVFPKIQLPRTPLTFSILTCTQIPHVNSAFHRKAHRCNLLSCGSWEAEPAAGGKAHKSLWGCSGEVVMMRYTLTPPQGFPHYVQHTYIIVYIYIYKYIAKNKSNLAKRDSINCCKNQNAKEQQRTSRKKNISLIPIISINE